MTGNSPDERAVAHELIVELLAHQFAFPVQWIETQKNLLAQEGGVDRLIELGPSSTLLGMAKKSLLSITSDGDRPIDQPLELYSASQNLAEACYQYESQAEAATVMIPAEPTPPSSTASAPAEPQATQARPAEPGVIAESPLNPEDIVRIHVARKLKKPINQISPLLSIKELCNGKSTLQNEIVGDMYTEFGVLPDRPEDVALRDLASAADDGTVVQLGRVSSMLIGKLVSSRMPAGFNVDAIRKQLLNKWGLGASIQSGILLYALLAEPESRLASAQAAEQYWDEAALRYAEFQGLSLRVSTSKKSDDAANTPTADAATLAAVNQSQTRLAQKQLEALAQYLQIDLSNTKVDELAQEQIAELQQKLDAVTAEFSDDFLTGISPTFDARQTRRYNSWWNCARRDLLDVFRGDCFANKLASDDLGQATYLRLMGNRSDHYLTKQACTLDAIMRRKAHGGLEQEFILFVDRLLDALSSGVERAPRALPALQPRAPRTLVTGSGDIVATTVARSELQVPTAYADFLRHPALCESSVKGPGIAVKQLSHGRWLANDDVTERLLELFADSLTDGIPFGGKNVLITGASPNSIGAEVARILLQGGAHVIVTTSRAVSQSASYFKTMYRECGAKGSELRVVQFNGASAKDCERLIDYVYSDSGLHLDLDAILPFAATAEAGIEAGEVTAANELAHRLMLVNVFRLLGRIIKNKRDRGIDCHPTQVLLPLSPNHGIFGGDGLYSESKLGLESLLNRVTSESWANELSVCGVEIGWTRSTGLMAANDIVAEAIEKHGVITFSSQEMAFNIAMLLTQEMVDVCEDQPVLVDYGGGLASLPNCQSVLAKARQSIDLEAQIARAVQEEDVLEGGPPKVRDSNKAVPQSVATLQIGFPRSLRYDTDLAPLHRLQALNSPENTVVVVGFAELGPWGSARLRWEMECCGKLSPSGLVEMAWLMGLITHCEGERKEGHYVGWVDAKTNEIVHEGEIERRYAKYITEHTGIRFVEPETAGYDPAKKEYFEELAIEEDMPAFEVSNDIADAFRLRHGENVSVHRLQGSDSSRVQVKKGATIFVPKTTPFSWGAVAGQLPTGWSPKRYGIPDDLAHQLDPATLVTLCGVMEAFYSAGIPEPFEIFKHMHLSELGNFIGSSMGGALKTKNLYKDAFLERPMDSDVLQDTYLNTTAAWVNMLLVGSAGPIKTPVGACATGLESIDAALESIGAGKTKMCIVGGFDDLQEDEAYGFSKMKATVNVAEELAAGRLPSEMSRPTAESRAGFVESHGCGIQIVCRGDVALEMGLPIYAILAGSAMASDKIGRSVPAPGQGVLSFAREANPGSQVNFAAVDWQSKFPGAKSSQDVSSLHSRSSSVTPTPPSSLPQDSPRSMSTNASTAPTTPLDTWQIGPPLSDTGRSTSASISPLRASLLRWGLDVNDLDIASLHGTSTKANDLNEPDVICQQMNHLGRSDASPLWAVCQKSVTGHPKAPAAAWMLNGCLQIVNSGIVPGNRNADNIDPALRRFKHLCFPTESVHLAEDVKAFLVTSFGFGQKGGQLVGIAPKYFLASLTEAEHDSYSARTAKRQRLANRRYVEAVLDNTIVKIQAESPFIAEDASRVYLDPLARICESTDVPGSYRFNPADLRNTSSPQTALSSWTAQEILRGQHSPGIAEAAKSCKKWIEKQNVQATSTVGIDVVQLNDFKSHENPIFIERNYTLGEVRYAKQSVDRCRAYAGRWAAKEAVFKCLRARSRGAGAAMKDIEVLRESKDDGPVIMLHGAALHHARSSGLETVQVSLSYGEDCVVAVALGLRGDGEPTYAL
ncbi:hypothetical protein CKM354_000939100 [Cercospora kikuchii]|uniref:Ketosynthase family 3 (KS3) domain-containing protein n=1 Tax=Cercospora kikuchii TaxID=84275 RepID=A0A9P3FJZ9_9PEZI|nr:uncharacterized protein CKM354_000939100 [Cercospora kikuchii]GIZ46259.1 hypothetical protein CKM354_000939100 [Cercospora kikuchii]